MVSRIVLMLDSTHCMIEVHVNCFNSIQFSLFIWNYFKATVTNVQKPPLIYQNQVYLWPAEEQVSYPHHTPAPASEDG